MSKIRFVGLDVHAETIAVAVAEPNGEVRSIGVIPNRLESIRKPMGKLGPAKQLGVCYEAGPTGYVLYWQLTQLGVAVRSGCTLAGANQSWGPGQDGPARRGETGTMPPRWRSHGGVGSR